MKLASRGCLSAVQTNGSTHILTRAAGDEPIVLDRGRRPIVILLKAHRLFAADVISRNEIETIADQPALQLSLIDHFEADAIARRIAPLQSRIATLVDEPAGLALLEGTLRAYCGSGAEQ